MRGDKEGFYEFIWSAQALFTTVHRTAKFSHLETLKESIIWHA